LIFTSDVIEAVAFADIIFIAVGTPADEDGSADLTYMLAVACDVGRLMGKRQ
jgi:UDPglucose 6-dehydrogenase